MRDSSTKGTPPEPINPVNRKALSRAGIAGAVLGVAAILLFVVFWVVLGALGVTKIPQLFLSLCVPPALMAGLVLIYARVFRARSQL
ncbi:MAG: hypothetical protein ABI835_03110 [Chloroflexota bacterium]